MALATTFADRGDWTVEQQFVLQMGSSLSAGARHRHAASTRCGDDRRSTRRRRVQSAGAYQNWTKHWSDGPTPGIFQVLVDGVADAATFGTDKVDWYWQRGGKIALKKGKHTLALHDLTGFDGRCDAVVLTTSDEMPGDSLDEYRAPARTVARPRNAGGQGRIRFRRGRRRHFGYLCGVGGRPSGLQGGARAGSLRAGRQQLVGGACRTGRPDQCRSLSVAGLPAQRDRPRPHRQRPRRPPLPG